MTNTLTYRGMALSRLQGVNLRYLRMLCRLSREEMAARYRLKSRTVKNWEAGLFKSFPRKALATARTMCRENGIAYCEDWLLYGINRMPEIRSLAMVREPTPLYRRESVDDTDNARDMSRTRDGDRQIVEEVLAFRNRHPDSLDLTIADNAMHPYFPVGSHVAGIGSVDDRHIVCLVGRPCIAKTRDGRVMLRMLYKRKNETHYTLACINHHTDAKDAILSDIELERVAPVMRLWYDPPNFPED